MSSGTSAIMQVFEFFLCVCVYYVYVCTYVYVRVRTCTCRLCVSVITEVGKQVSMYVRA